MPGFLANAAIGLGTGVAEAGNEMYDQSAKEQQALLANRGRQVDQVNAQQQKVNEQAQSVANSQRNLVAQYNIDPDLAYTLSTDPRYKDMDPDKLGGIISRMQPTGKTVPGTPAYISQGTPGTCVNKGALFGGSYSVPGVGGVAMPSTPSRQGYQLTPDMGDITKKNFPPPVDQAQADAQQTYFNWNKNNPGKEPPSDLYFQAFKKGEADATTVSNRRDTILGVISRVGSGELPASLAPAAVQAASGHPEWAQGINWAGMTPHQQDPAIQQRTGNFRVRLSQLYPDADPIQVQSMAMYMSNGGMKTVTDQFGNSTTVDEATGRPMKETLDQTLGGQAKQPTQSSTTVPSSPTTPNSTQANPSTSQAAGQTAASTSTAPFKMPPSIPQPWVSKTVLPKVEENVMNFPQALAQIHYAENFLQGHPNAVGLAGNVNERVMGPLVNLGNLISPDVGGSVDRLFDTSSVGQTKAAFDLLQATLTRPIISEITTGRAGFIYCQERKEIDSTFNTDDPHMTYQKLQKNMTVLKNGFYNSMVDNINVLYPPQGNLAGDQNAQAQRYQLLTQGLHLQKTDAFEVMKREMQIQQNQR